MTPKEKKDLALIAIAGIVRSPGSDDEKREALRAVIDAAQAQLDALAPLSWSQQMKADYLAERGRRSQ